MKIDCKTGEYELPAALLEAYAAIYPTAEQEFARMVIWLESNPSRRPASAKSAPRFIANWFRRVPKRLPTKQDQRADTVRQLTGESVDKWFFDDCKVMPMRNPFEVRPDMPEGLKRLIGRVTQ